VIDLENGRYVGVLVAYGGVLGIGEKLVLVPSMALTNPGVPRTLSLDMSVEKFRNAPIFQMSDQAGPPAAAKLAEIYRYFGLQPYFASAGTATSATGEPLPQLCFIQAGSRILLMPVDNLQGKTLGWVYGLRGLQLGNERFKGIVITPTNALGSGDYKLVRPEDLRYNDRHTRLRLNDHDQVFHDSADFAINANGHYQEGVLDRPGTAPLAQGTSATDQLITASIQRSILADADLAHYAKSIEISTTQGKTTVRGNVPTPSDHEQIIAYATKAAGPGNVTDLLSQPVPTPTPISSPIEQSGATH